MRSIVATLAVLALAAAPVRTQNAQQPAASSAAASEQTVRELIRAMNASDPAALRTFVTERFVIAGPNAVPVDERVERLRRLRTQMGALTLRSVEPNRGNEVSALVQVARTESWRRLTIFVE